MMVTVAEQKSQMPCARCGHPIQVVRSKDTVEVISELKGRETFIAIHMGNLTKGPTRPNT